MLWFDLMFDVQALRGAPDEDALASISGYYGRVTTGARPMNRLVAAVMVATLAALVAEVASGDDPRWAAVASLALTLAAVVVAGARTVPDAVRMGERADRDLARSIGRDHLFCLAAISATLILQLAVVR